MWRWMMIILGVILMTTVIVAQDESPLIVITAENIGQLQSVAQINLTDGYLVPSLNPEQPDPIVVEADFDTGWFVMESANGRFTLIDHEQVPIPLTIDGLNTYRQPLYTLANDVTLVFIDGTYGRNLFASVYTDGARYYVSYDVQELYGAESPMIIVVESVNFPAAVWLNCPDAPADDFFAYRDCHAWLEVLPGAADGLPFVMRMPSMNELTGQPFPYMMSESDAYTLPYMPAQDDTAIGRIGRIPHPYVVTSSVDGVVKLWNLETGEVIAQAQTPTGEPAVFGQVNTEATHLVWRDQQNLILHVLDFTTGEDRVVAQLDGQYVQWYFLTPDADAVIAVNIGLEPVVVAWDVATGERYNLGAYRECGRVPDRARLSADGTTLVIGCDTGLDVWRVVAG